MQNKFELTFVADWTHMIKTELWILISRSSQYRLLVPCVGGLAAETTADAADAAAAAVA